MTERNKGAGHSQATVTGPRLVTIDTEAADRRLDNFLMGELKGLPKTRIYRMIRKGEVRVNKGRAKAAYRLVEGDVVRVPPARGLHEAGTHSISQAGASWINDHVLFEDKWLLILNKPSGLAVHGGSGINQGAIELLRAARPDEHYLELVHRLDRDTSGCLLIAKKRSSLRRLHEVFREGRISKIYHALLVGQWTGDAREVALPLVTEQRRGGERHVRPGEDGKKALTRFYPEQYYSNYVYARVELFTGRTHQIRVHASAIGHPVAGDERYGIDADRPANLRRLFLHASQLGFDHPDSGQPVSFKSPLDGNLRQVLRDLEADRL